MARQRTDSVRFLVVYPRPGWFPVLTLLAALVFAIPGTVVADEAAKTVANQPTRFLIFNLVPGGDYQIRHNGAAAGAQTASFAGRITFAQTVTSGDRILITLTGINTAPPSQPTGVVAQGTDIGCANLSWNANPESDVVGYVVYLGTTSVESGQASQYDDSVTVGNVTSRSVCGLATGTYYLAVRAKNAVGLLSPLSSEATAVVTNGTAQGPLPPQGVAVSETAPGCVTVSWRAGGEPDLAGYVVYYAAQSVAGGQAPSYTDSIDVGNTTSREICGFSQGARYFAVRAYNAASEFSSYSIERRIDVVGPDVTAPVLSGATPADGATAVPTNNAIFFILGDGQSGVDTNSVSVLVNGTPCPDITFSGVPSSYTVVCDPGALPTQTTINVSVAASDLANPANTLNTSWSFTTGGGVDSSPPVFCCENPAADATGVLPSSPVRIRVSDSESGVDLSSIDFRVNGQPVTFTVTGDSYDATLEYGSSVGFAPGSFVDVDITACDLASSPNCDTYSFTFEVSGAVSTAAASASIVPDGFWANDPTRPLEVRNIPLGWTVRIFDTAGLQVRTWKNVRSDGYDWTWDFNNDHGMRVARALYLVRVTDDGGQVQTRGKFLVQSDR